MRKETCSLAFGMTGRFAGASRGFVVAALNAASAFCRGSGGRRGRSKGISATHDLAPRWGMVPDGIVYQLAQGATRPSGVYGSHRTEFDFGGSSVLAGALRNAACRR